MLHTGQIGHFRKPHGGENDVSDIVLLDHLNSWNLKHQIEADEVAKGYAEGRGKDSKIRC